MKRSVPFYLTAAALGLIAVLVGALSVPAQTVTTVSVGSAPQSVAVNTVTNKIYVANCGIGCPGGTGGGSVTVIDGATNSTATVPTGETSVGIATNTVTNRIYVANQADNTVTVIDGDTNSTTKVPTGNSPRALAVNPNTNKIYVATARGSYPPGSTDSVVVIDGATNSTTTIPVGFLPGAVAVNHVTNKIYVATCSNINNCPLSSGTVTVIDGATNSTTTVPIGHGPHAFAVNPNTNKIYVVNAADNTLTVIDGDTNSTTTFLVGGGPIAVAVNPVTNTIYTVNNGSADITAIDGGTDAVTPINVTVFAIAVNTATNQIYGADRDEGIIRLIDGLTNSSITVVDNGETSSPIAVAVNSNTNKIYVANEGNNTVTVIDGGVITVSLKPGNLNFGSHALETTSVARVSAKNTGLGHLMFSNIGMTGANAGDFTEINNCTGVIDPAVSCTVAVTFRPSALGARTAALTFTDNGQGSPQSVPLSGTGVQQTTIAPNALKFASQLVGTTSAPKNVTFANNLSTALPITISFAGANPGDFLVTGSTSCGSSVPAKSHCTISVAFAPKASGPRTATLEVNDTANNSPQTVALSGTGQ